ncbi:type II toxin-antitoxin system RelE/ParE family toxin [Bordetella genomosp. 13]|uniref:Addiction module toxin RelE n=1 Tax=Bordetella genomosp. 13 TaxID=463040 RepID=A0A1W6Z739_9BORD|nr:type II toxin-antitoxin system RelE/ParE family toxin [Bordetella genomosp. 13]ARP92940.1 hypothetical protein CAL15_00225 [Bordetella genomosp. 13]
MKIFTTKGVTRFTRREGVPDASLRTAIERVTRGSIDADLGGGLIKQRVARPGQGRSGGFRMILAYRQADRAVFLYGFAKNDRDNVSSDELQALRTIGANWLAASAAIIRQALVDGDLQEIEHDHQT